MANLIQLRGTPFSNGTSFATLAVATQNAVVGKTPFATTIAGSSDKYGARLILKDVTQGTLFVTLLGSQPFVISFNPPIPGTTNSTMTAVVDGGVTTASVFLSGYLSEP